MFKTKVLNKESGILLFGITPPKAHNSSEKLKEIASKTKARIQKFNVDGLVIYDLQDESSRNPKERPFPFSPTMDPHVYASVYLQDLNVPKILYRSIGKLTKHELISWINILQNSRNTTVFVGTPSPDFQSTLKLSDAYQLWQQFNKNNILGGVSIPERHHIDRTEHLKISDKMKNGCSFFISQCVYNIEFAKNVLSDLLIFSKQQNLEMPTIIFTLTTCGSIKTLEFMDWLGINVPIWLRNELYYSEDILTKSLDICLSIAEEITRFCLAKSIPFGINVESISIRKEEIEASEYLLYQVEEIFVRYGLRECGVKLQVDGFKD